MARWVAGLYLAYRFLTPSEPKVQVALDGKVGGRPLVS
jgi:hypothetical protein